MFPSSNNGNDPISYSYQQAYNRPFFNDIIPNSKQEELPFSSFHCPPSFVPPETELDDWYFFWQQNRDLFLHQQPLRPINTTVSENNINMLDSNKNDVNKKSPNSIEQIPRKRSSRRDRHSKINTRQGPRDRRMRLSLKVARPFFDLQDKLGFDKPSKTVEWLLIQSRPEIKKLYAGLPNTNYSCSVGNKSASSTSECEVVSGIDEAAIKGSISRAKPSLCVKKERKSRPRKTAFHPLARESREKARARARERTREKMRSRTLIDESKLCEEATNQDFNQLSCWSPFETGEESGTQSHNMNISLEVLTEVEAPSSHGQEQLGTTEGMIDDSLAIIGKWSPSSIFYLPHNTGIPLEVSSKEKFPDFTRC